LLIAILLTEFNLRHVSVQKVKSREYQEFKNHEYQAKKPAKVAKVPAELYFHAGLPCRRKKRPLYIIV